MESLADEAVILIDSTSLFCLLLFKARLYREFSLVRYLGCSGTGDDMTALAALAAPVAGELRFHSTTRTTTDKHGLCYFSVLVNVPPVDRFAKPTHSKTGSRSVRVVRGISRNSMKRAIASIISSRCIRTTAIASGFWKSITPKS